MDAEQTRQFDERLRKIENELAKISSMLESEQGHQRLQIDQQRLLLEEHRRLLTGDGEHEGLIAWRNRMNARYGTVIKIMATIGAALLELLRERISELLR